MLFEESDNGGELSLSVEFSKVNVGGVNFLRILVKYALVLEQQLRIALFDFFVVRGESSDVLSCHNHLVLTSFPYNTSCMMKL